MRHPHRRHKARAATALRRRNARALDAIRRLTPYASLQGLHEHLGLRVSMRGVKAFMNSALLKAVDDGLLPPEVRALPPRFEMQLIESSDDEKP